MKAFYKHAILLCLLLLYVPTEYIAGTSHVFFYEEPELAVQADSMSPIIKDYFDKLVGYGFNGGLLAAKNGKVIFREISGFADIQQKQPFSINSKFQLASVSKQFTASAIMLLFDKGLLSFKDSVEFYFPKFPYTGITIENLLHHRSGLPEYQYFNDSILEIERPLNNKKIIEYIIEVKPVKYNIPGVQFNYCNTNYVVLAAIVEKISGMTFPSFMKEYIFEPAGLKNTIVYETQKKNSYTELTVGHRFFGKKIPDNFLDEVYGDKGVYSSLNDMFIWDRVLNSGKIIRKSTLEKAFVGGNPNTKFYKNYGYGWRLFTLSNEQTMIYHAGWWHGNNSLYVKLPYQDFTLIILTNKRTQLFFGNYKTLINNLFPGSFIYKPLDVDIVKEIKKIDSISIDSISIDSLSIDSSLI